MELKEIIKKRLEAKGCDLYSEYFDDEGLALLNEVILETEAALRQSTLVTSLPVYNAIKEIENLMERWHLCRDNDSETLQGINDVLLNIGLLDFFNKNQNESR